MKAPGTERSKLEHEELLSTSAFKFNLRRYNLDGGSSHASGNWKTFAKLRISQAGACTRSHFRST